MKWLESVVGGEIKHDCKVQAAWGTPETESGWYALFWHWTSLCECVRALKWDKVDNLSAYYKSFIFPLIVFRVRYVLKVHLTWYTFVSYTIRCDSFKGLVEEMEDMSWVVKQYLANIARAELEFLNSFKNCWS